MPAVSVLLPFRNAAATLLRCLDSIAHQTSGNYEVVAINDHSEDDGPHIVAQRAMTDPRIRLIHARGRGLVSALNEGLAQCRAALVARMDADDAMHPHRLEKQLEFLNANTDIDVLGTRVEATSDTPLSDGFRAYVDWQNSCLSERDIADDIYVESPYAHPSVCFRRQTVLHSGGYRDGDFPEDYELWLRLAAAGRRMAKLPEVLLKWHDHPERLSRTDPRCSRTAFDRLRARFLAADPRVRAASDRLCIWGAGRRTRQRLRHLFDFGITPRAWIDIDPAKIGNRLRDAPVLSPEGLGHLPGPFVLSCVTNHGARVAIDAHFKALGLSRGRDYLHVG